MWIIWLLLMVHFGLSANDTIVINCEPGLTPPTDQNILFSKYRRDNSVTNDFYTTELVQISHSGADLVLQAALTIPNNKKQYPVLLLLSDSGPHEMDGNLHGHKIFELLTDFLGRNGIAVIRYDERGVGGSGGTFTDSTMDDFANDATTVLQWTRKKLGKQISKIGVLGHGEGSFVALQACQDGANPDFLIWMGSPALRGDKALLEQNSKLLRASGIPDSTTHKFVDLVHIFSQTIRFEKDNNQVLEQISHSLQNQSVVFTASEKSILPISKLELMALATQMCSPWMRSYLNFDPLKKLSKCAVPLLALYAELDHETPVVPNITTLREYATQTNNDRIIIKEMKAHNHLFQKCELGSIEEYTRLDSEISFDVLNIMSNWIKAQ